MQHCKLISYAIARPGVILLMLAMLSGSTHVYAQDSSKPKPWYENITVNGFLSSSYSYNFNKPDARKNQLRVFDVEDNSFNVDVVELSIKKDAATPGEAGFRFDLTAGSSIPRVARSSGLNIGDLDLQQMFVTYIAPVGKGLRFDFGKFVTHLGYEVIEGYDGYNDNESRSFLFGYAIAFTHTGVRASYPLSDNVTASLMLVNGWDNSIDNNRSKSIGGQIAVTPVQGMSLIANAMYGPERDRNNSDNRTILDFVGTCAVSDLVTLGLNVDYGTEQHAAASGKNAVWKGAAAYIRLNLLDQFSLSLRLEQFEDRDGVRTGIAQRLRGLTITPEYRPAEHFILRGDFRIDDSNKSVFVKRGELTNVQSTVSMNAICVL